MSRMNFHSEEGPQLSWLQESCTSLQVRNKDPCSKIRTTPGLTPASWRTRQVFIFSRPPFPSLQNESNNAHLSTVVRIKWVPVCEVWNVEAVLQDNLLFSSPPLIQQPQFFQWTLRFSCGIFTTVISCTQDALPFSPIASG